LVDDGLHFTVAFIHRSRPCVQKGGTETAERHRAKVPLVDAEDLETTAVAIGWATRFELTGTPVVTVTAPELNPFDVPINLWHSEFPSWILSGWAASRWPGCYAVGRAAVNGPATRSPRPPAPARTAGSLAVRARAPEEPGDSDHATCHRDARAQAVL